MKKLHIYILSIGFLFLISCEDVLKESPVHQPTIDNAITDFESAKQLLNGMYNSLVSGALGDDLSLNYSSLGGFYEGSSSYFNMSYNDESEFWRQSYDAINAANTTIRLLSDLADDIYPSIDEKNSMIAEAKAYRAYTYTHLLYSFCYWWDEMDSPYGLIYRDQIADLTNLDVPRLTVGESYAKIIEDLDEAILNAPDFSSSSYLSKQMAMVLKAKLLLNRGEGADYENALVLVQDVKSSAFLENDIKAMYANSLNSQEVLWAQNILGANKDPQRVAREYSYTFSLWFSGFMGDMPPGQNINAIYVRDWLADDPRFPEISGTVIHPEWWADWNVQTLTKLVIQGQRTDNITVYYFRWAELYLMESELIARTDGEIDDALVPVNNLRASRTTISLPPLVASSEQEFYDLLFKEYWAELALENGSEYFASLRFMKDGKEWIHTLKPDLTFTKANLVIPIPVQEINQNKLAVQNPVVTK